MRVLIYSVPLMLGLSMSAAAQGSAFYKYDEKGFTGSAELSEVSGCTIKQELGCASVWILKIQIQTISNNSRATCELAATEEPVARIFSATAAQLQFKLVGDDATFDAEKRGRTFIIKQNIPEVCGSTGMFAGRWSLDPKRQNQEEFYSLTAYDTRDGELARSDKELNRVYSTIMEQLDIENQKVLKAAQHAWITMRDNDCKWAFVDVRDCLMDRTDNRTEELQETYFQSKSGAYQNIGSEISEPHGEYNALTHRLVIGRCHMDGCWWFSIESPQKQGSSQQGDLFAVSMKEFEADCPDGYTKCGPRRLTGQSISYVFCSKVKPSVIFGPKDDGKWNARLVHPKNVAGVTESTFNIYWAACHNVGVYEDVDVLGRKFGYSFTPDTELDEMLNTPFDALKW